MHVQREREKKETHTITKIHTKKNKTYHTSDHLHILPHWDCLNRTLHRIVRYSLSFPHILLFLLRWQAMCKDFQPK
jgi:hypothetical protein